MKNFLIKLFPNATKAWAAGVGAALAGLVGAAYPDTPVEVLTGVAFVSTYGLTWLLPNKEV